MPATVSVDLRSERPAPDRTAQQSYREELERQVCEKKLRREREKKEIEAYELKADLKVKQVLAGEVATAAGPGPAGTADKGKENSAVQQDQHQLLAHSSKALSTTEQPVQEGTHDPATRLDRQPNQGRHDRNPQPARANDPPHLDRQLEAERPRHISSSADQISTSADPELRRQLEHERQRVRQLTDECEALRQREAQQQQQLRAVQERQVEWERRSAQDDLEWRSLLEVASWWPLSLWWRATACYGYPSRLGHTASGLSLGCSTHTRGMPRQHMPRLLRPQRQHMPPASARTDVAHLAPHLAPRLAPHLAPRSAQVATAGGAEDAGGGGGDAARCSGAAAAAAWHAAAARHPRLHPRLHPRHAARAVRARGPFGCATLAPRHAAAPPPGVGGRPAGGRDSGGRRQCLRVRCVRLQAAVCRPQSAAQAWVRGPRPALQARVCGPALVGVRCAAAAPVTAPVAAAGTAFECRLRYGEACHGTERGGARHRAERGAAEASRRLPQAWHRPSRWQSPSRWHLPSNLVEPRGAADLHDLMRGKGALRGARGSDLRRSTLYSQSMYLRLS